MDSRYIQELPLIFIFGIATSPSTIQHMLPHSVSSLLCIELFQSLSCTQHLATVIDKVFISDSFQCICLLWLILIRIILFCSWFWPHSIHSSSVGRFYRCWWASFCTMISQSATLLKACRWADATARLYIAFWFLCIWWISHLEKVCLFLYSWPCWSTSTHSLSVCSAVRKRSFWPMHRNWATMMWRWSASCPRSWGDPFIIAPGKLQQNSSTTHIKCSLLVELLPVTDRIPCVICG